MAGSIRRITIQEQALARRRLMALFAEKDRCKNIVLHDLRPLWKQLREAHPTIDTLNECAILDYKSRNNRADLDDTGDEHASRYISALSKCSKSTFRITWHGAPCVWALEYLHGLVTDGFGSIPIPNHFPDEEISLRVFLSPVRAIVLLGSESVVVDDEGTLYQRYEERRRAEIYAPTPALFSDPKQLAKDAGALLEDWARSVIAKWHENSTDVPLRNTGSDPSRDKQLADLCNYLLFDERTIVADPAGRQRLRDRCKFVGIDLPLPADK